jgi:hypothetical protein
VAPAGTWTAIENLSQSEWEDGNPLLYFDSRGQGLLLWTRRYAAYQGAPADGTDLLGRTWQGDAWSTEKVLNHEDFFLPGAYGLIPVETPDGILIFVTWQNGYQTAEFQDGVWSSPSAWTYLLYRNPDVTPRLHHIVRDASGRLHAAAFGENSSQTLIDKYYDDAYYLAFDGHAWSTPLNLSATDGVANQIALAFDGQGRLHYLWSDPDPPYSSESDLSAIWGRVYVSDTWSLTNTQVTAYNADQAIADFDLTVDLSGTLHLAWSEGLVEGLGHRDLDIYYQTGDGLAWGPEETVYSSTLDSRYPSLVVTGTSPALAWQEGTALGGDILFSERKAPPPERYRIYLPLVQH